jgi:hypothetical protein
MVPDAAGSRAGLGIRVMNEVMLGCPHCAKPVGFTPTVAGQVVSCPSCRRAFQMPDRPPVASPKASGRPDKVVPPAGANLDFDDGPASAPPGRARAAIDSYRAAVTLANVFALVGTAGVIFVAGLAVYSFILPIFRGPDGRTPSAVAGALWLVSVVILTAFGITAVFLVRVCVLVGVDAARTLRALERDSAAPKSK